MKRYIVIILLLILPFFVFAQVNIGGSNLNTYYKVTSATQGVNVISCAGENLSDLSPGDKVLLIQMTGAAFEPSIPFEPDSVPDPNAGSGGKYEFLSVLSVNDVSDIVTFTAKLKNNYTAGESIQLVKVFETAEANVMGALSAPDWDSTTGKGGILALIITQKLTLTRNINMAGRGFGGADPLLYSIGCRPSTASDTMYYLSGSINRGGLKGEGIKSKSYNYTIGPGNNFNGGGGGIGKFGGGGGGSNYDYGGRGGSQQIYCGTNINQVAKGGYGLETGSWGGTIYLTGFYTLDANKKITFGGGGGGSTDSTGLSSTKGGDGGGLVIILADTLEGNGGRINADGLSVSGIATAGAGGGGAGGTLLLDVATYSGAVTLNLNGGNGGDTDASSNCGGAGGGGAGGVILNSNASLPGFITTNISAGSGGTANCSGSNNGQSGADGAVINNYQLVLNGFTFNAITGNDTLCAGQQPIELIGTVPKGATDYEFKWLQSNDNQNWTPIIGATNKDYQPPVLSDTTYYTREVFFPTDGIRDTAISVEILVYPLILNNIINATDTVCEASIPGLLSASNVVGGNGFYTYDWESSTDQIIWIPKGDESSLQLNETNPLFETTYYRRRINSGPGDVCQSLSNIDTIFVLDPITNNQLENFQSDTSICFGLSGGKVLGSTPGGGEVGDYRYSWLRSSDNITYTDIASASNQSYVVGMPNTIRYYKRIVYSGNDDACIDTMLVPRTVIVLPSIVNNLITSDSTLYCNGDNGSELKQLSSSPISGGDGTFTYQWQVYNGLSWDNLGGQTNSNYSPGILVDTMVYRRIAFSGKTSTVDVCVDTTTPLSINVLDVINNVLVSSNENICQGSAPAMFSEGNATGGAGGGSFTYKWEQNPNAVGWEDAAGVNTNADYSPEVLNISTEFRRIATSQICSNISDPINIQVYDSITQNQILGAGLQYACYNAPKSLAGTSPLGGNGSYTYNWELSTDGINWADAGGTNQNFTSSDLLVPTYFRRSITSGDLGQCEHISNRIFTQINTSPTGDILNGIDTLCGGEEITISYSNLTLSSPWSIELGDAAGVVHSETNITAPTGSITFPINRSADIRILSLQDDSLCYSDTSLNSGIVLATVYQVPEANPGDDFEVCGLTTTMRAQLSISNGSTGLWTSSEGSFNDPTLHNTTVDMGEDNYGEKVFTWTETNWNCVDQEVVSIIFYEQPAETDAGEDQTLPYTFITKLEAAPASLPELGFWKFVQGEGEFSDSTQSDTDVEMDAVGEYILKWTIENGVCTPVSDEMRITINDLELSNAFSPNADGVNDVYELVVPSGNNIKLILLDRNGRKVNEINGSLELEWDGKNDSGQDLPEDTYYYILEEDGGPTRNGFIELRR